MYKCQMFAAFFEMLFNYIEGSFAIKQTVLVFTILHWPFYNLSIKHPNECGLSVHWDWVAWSSSQRFHATLGVGR